MKAFDPESGFVRTTTRTPLRPHDPNDYIVRFESELRRYVADDEGNVGEVADDDGDPSVRVATVEWAVLNFDAAVNDGQSLFDVVDAESSEMVWVYETIRRPSAPEDDEDLVFEMWGNVLYFRDFDVTAEYDPREVARSVIDHVLRFHGPAAGAVFIFGVHDSRPVRDAFKDCGFEVVRKIDDMEFLTLDLAMRRPPPADRTNVHPIRRRPVRKD
ncbi:MAG TPA: hypothetical protein VFE30_09530 [Anaeromyxobacteraceae bacterium]|jgi:hypothetical protein|nr:hypothetical protein [Anaeromyxobacteraceae bacterium]